MTNHEGAIATNNTHIHVPMQPSDDHGKIFELATVQISDYDTAADTAISRCHKAKPQDTSSYDTDTYY